MLYLASKSPRRAQLLQQIGVSFDVVDVDVEEVPGATESPGDYVKRLAEAKAKAGAERLSMLQIGFDAPVIGADTIGVCEGRILEKPADEDAAVAMLQHLSGRIHQVLSAVSLCRRREQSTRLSVTSVKFRPLSESECRVYWRTGEPRDKAGGYGIQGLGAVFVESINGSYSGVVGLPIEETIALLRDFNIPWWTTTGWR
jgi:septum formation protein